MVVRRSTSVAEREIRARRASPFQRADDAAFRAAADEADGPHHDEVSWAYILLGELRERESPAAMLLIDQGLGAGRVRAELHLLRAETRPMTSIEDMRQLEFQQVAVKAF